MPTLDAVNPRVLNNAVKSEGKVREARVRGAQQRRSIKVRGATEASTFEKKQAAKVATSSQIESNRANVRKQERTERDTARNVRSLQREQAQATNATFKSAQRQQQQRSTNRTQLAVSAGNKIAPAPRSSVSFRNVFMAGLFAIFGMIIIYDFVSHPDSTNTALSGLTGWIRSLSLTTPLFTTTNNGTGTKGTIPHIAVASGSIPSASNVGSGLVGYGNTILNSQQ